jgi:hypothetical protein
VTVVAVILPILSKDRVASAMWGPPVPATVALGSDLRHGLPPALVEAIDKIGGQIATDILDPLLCSVSGEQAATTFERVFPRFRDYYLSTALIMWGFLERDPRRLSDLTVQSFHEMENLIRTEGPRWIGSYATPNLLHGLATMIRVTKAATRMLDPAAQVHQIDESQAESWANSIIAYSLTMSTVLVGLTALIEGRPSPARLETIATIAHWSKIFAVKAYHLTKVMGLLRTASPGNPIRPEDDEDDLSVAAIGLDSYAESLRQDDLA